MKKAMDVFVAVLAILFVLNFITKGNSTKEEKETSKYYNTINVCVEWDEKVGAYYFTDYHIDDKKVICDVRYNSDELFAEIQKMAAAAENVEVTMKCGATVPTPKNITYIYVH